MSTDKIAHIRAIANRSIVVMEQALAEHPDAPGHVSDRLRRGIEDERNTLAL